MGLFFELILGFYARCWVLFLLCLFVFGFSVGVDLCYLCGLVVFTFVLVTGWFVMVMRLIWFVCLDCWFWYVDFAC